MTELEKHINRIPNFMYPDLTQVENIDDLLFQLQHEIDLAEEGQLSWSTQQLREARVFYATVSKVA